MTCRAKLSYYNYNKLLSSWMAEGALPLNWKFVKSISEFSGASLASDSSYFIRKAQDW